MGAGRPGIAQKDSPGVWEHFPPRSASRSVGTFSTIEHFILICFCFCFLTLYRPSQPDVPKCTQKLPARPAGRPAGRATSANPRKWSCAGRFVASRVQIWRITGARPTCRTSCRSGGHSSGAGPRPTCRTSGRSGKAGRRVTCPHFGGKAPSPQVGPRPKWAQDPSGPGARSYL